MVVVGGNYCPVSGKECFESRALAEKAMQRLNKRSAKKGSVYQCPECGKWHITHFGYNKDKEKRAKMARGKMKSGADTGFLDTNNAPIRVGDFVRHTITGASGFVGAYGLVEGKGRQDKYRLGNNVWEILDAEQVEKENKEPGYFTKQDVKDVVGEGPKVVEKKDTVAVVENEAGEKKLAVLVEKTLADFSIDEIVEYVVDLAADDKLSARQAVVLTDVAVRHGYDDKYLAEELRKRGYEVTAEKTVKISL